MTATHHHHDHHHHDHGSPSDWGKAFGVGIGLNVAFVAIEIVYGLAANSSALLADAGHNASDVLGLVFAWTAIGIATKRPSGKYTYGLRRTTVLASILNAVLILAASVAIAWTAIDKLRYPTEVVGGTIMVVAGIGVVINTVTALMFVRGQKSDLNIKGAFLHMAADAAVSLGVVIAGLVIRATGMAWIDAVMSLVIVAVIIYGTWGLLRDSVSLALDAAPRHVDIERIRAFLEEIDGVEEVHDLHIWGLSTTETALTVHMVVPEGGGDGFIFDIRTQLHERFGIDHTTIQIETTFEDAEYRHRCC